VGGDMSTPHVLHGLTDEARIEAHETERDLHLSIMVRGAVQEAVTEAIKAHVLPDAERAYLSLAVRRAARWESLQTAIIEKSLTGLVWAGILFTGYVLLEFLKQHGWKQ
jgi:hypothetical protein